MAVLRANRLSIYFFFLAALHLCFANENQTNSEAVISVESTNDKDQSAANFKLQVENILKELNQVDQLIFKNERKLEYIGSIRNSKSKQKQRIHRQKKGGASATLNNNTNGNFTNSYETKEEENQIDESSLNEENSRENNDLDSQEYIFLNKLLKKNELKFDSEVVDFSFLSTRPYNQNTGTFLLLVLLSNNTVLLLDNLGQVIQNLHIEHNASRIHISPFMDEYIFTTFGSKGSIRIHVVNIDKDLDSKNNVYDANLAKSSIQAKFQNEIFFEPEHQITSVVTHMIRGVKMMFISDDQGNIRVFLRNGTMKSVVKATENVPIVQMIRYFSTVLYATPNNIGFLNLQSMKPNDLRCLKFEAEIIDISLDASNGQLVYVLLKNLNVYVLEVKVSQEGSCRLVYKLEGHRYFDAPTENSHYKIYPTRVYLLLLDSSNNKFAIFNTTDINSENFKLERPFTSVIYQKTLPGSSNIQYVVHKNSLQSTYFACVEKTNQKSEIHLFEMLTPVKPVTDVLSYLRIPIIVIAILGVFGYQFWMRKKKTTGKGGKGKGPEYSKAEKFARKHMDDLGEERLTQKKGYKQSDDLNPEEFKKIAKYQESLEFLNKKTQELSNNLEKLKSSGGPASKIKELQETLDSLHKLE